MSVAPALLESSAPATKSLCRSCAKHFDVRRTTRDQITDGMSAAPFGLYPSRRWIECDHEPRATSTLLCYQTFVNLPWQKGKAHIPSLIDAGLPSIGENAPNFLSQCSHISKSN